MSEHVKRVGEIIVNLQTLEFLLRRFLFGMRREHAEKRYENLVVGDEVSENSFTNYQTLRQLIKDYNTQVPQSRPELKLSISDLTRLRDALAHGRIFSVASDDDYLLLKFSKPVDGKIKVTYCENMDDAWYQTNGQLTFKAIGSVMKAGKLLHIQGFDVAGIVP
jgi:hypothetical protein